MSHAHSDDPTVPRSALIAVAVLLLATLALTASVRFGLVPRSADPEMSRAQQNIAPAEERQLRFTDRADGAVVVTDAVSGAEVKVIEFGKGGFVRATLRRMAKARIAAGIGAEPAFKLVRWENGALSLSDPQTGREAELHGFGSDHSLIFAEMLEGPTA